MTSLDTTNTDSGEGTPQWIFNTDGIFIWDSGGDSASWTDPLNWDRDSDYPRDNNDAALIMSTGMPLAHRLLSQQLVP